MISTSYISQVQLNRMTVNLVIFFIMQICIHLWYETSLVCQLVNLEGDILPPHLYSNNVCHILWINIAMRSTNMNNKGG